MYEIIYISSASIEQHSGFQEPEIPEPEVLPNWGWTLTRGAVAAGGSSSGWALGVCQAGPGVWEEI